MEDQEVFRKFWREEEEEGKKRKKKKTRPDTRPIPVADGWAGAEMHVSPLFDSCSRTDGPTDQLSDGWTDGRLKESLVRD